MNIFEKGIRIIISIILFILLHIPYSYTQNLINNSSFEDLENGFPKDWSIVSGTPDYQQQGDNNPTIQVSPKFKETESKNHVGFAFGYQWSEVMSSTLKTPLIKGQTYEITLQVFIKNNCIEGLEAITVGLTRHSLVYSKKPKNYHIKTIEINTKNKFKQGEQWYTLKKVFKAHGGEKYINIGNFNNKNEKNIVLKSEDLGKRGIQIPCNYLTINSIELTLKELIKKEKMTTPKVKKVITLEDITFESGKSEINTEALPFLNQVSQELIEANAKIIIVGHTDNIGSEKDNLSLSISRAKAIQNYFIQKGIVQEHIKTEGKGESNPIAQNDTQEGRKVNRRVEIKLLE